MIYTRFGTSSFRVHHFHYWFGIYRLEMKHWNSGSIHFANSKKIRFSTVCNGLERRRFYNIYKRLQCIWMRSRSCISSPPLILIRSSFSLTPPTHTRRICTFAHSTKATVLAICDNDAALHRWRYWRESACTPILHSNSTFISQPYTYIYV